MRYFELNPSERYMFGEFLTEMAKLITNQKLNDLRSGVTIEQSSVEAPRVRVEFSFYLTPEAHALLLKVHANYLAHRDSK